MTKLNAYAPFVARLLMSVLFIVAAYGKLSNVAGFTGYLTSGGLPAFLAWPAILFEVIVAVSLILGFLLRPVALLAAGFCVLTGLMFHFNPADQMSMTMFFKNLGLAGGFLMFYVHGAGKVALDRA